MREMISSKRNSVVATFVRGRENSRLRRLCEGVERQPFGERHQPHEMLRLEEEEVQLRRADLARAQHAFDRRTDHEDVAGLQFLHLGARDPVEVTMADEDDFPARGRVLPFRARREFALVYEKVSQEVHVAANCGGLALRTDGAAATKPQSSVNDVARSRARPTGFPPRFRGRVR